MMRGCDSSALEPFEGLVHTTAHMFASQVRREEDDLAQELRVRVWRACQMYDPAKSHLSLERYVFQAITNKVKDYKRDAAREAGRRERYGLTFFHIEDTYTEGTTETAAERFASLYYYVTRDEVYGEIDDTFTLPAGVTERETNVLLLMMMELSKTEIVVRLGIERDEVDKTVVSLRAKFADWQPRDCSRTLSAVSAARAEGELIGSRAA